MQAPRPPSEASGSSPYLSRAQRLTDDHDAMSLTTSNPFEEEQDFSSYQIVSRLMNKVKNTFVPSLQLGSSTPSLGPTSPSIGGPVFPTASSSLSNLTDARVRSPTQKGPPPNPVIPQTSAPQVTSPPLSTVSRAKSPSPSNRGFPLAQSNPLPPLVSLTPVTSSVDVTLPHSSSRLPSRIAMHGYPRPFGQSPPSTTSLYPPESNLHSIPGFPLADDARTVASVATNAGLKRTESVSKVIRRIRGEGLSKKYWMEDEHCKECYDCKSVFTTWRRKHHCRICGQIFCSRCASNLIKATRFNAEGTLRVCNLCLKVLEDEGAQSDEDDRHSISSMTPSLPAFHGHSGLDMPYLASIAERERSGARSRRESDASGHPITPPDGMAFSIEDMGLIGRLDDGGYYAGWEGEAVPPPFRRGFADADEDKDAALGGYSSPGIRSPSPNLATISPRATNIHSSSRAAGRLEEPSPATAGLGVSTPYAELIPSPCPATGGEKSSVTFPSIGSMDALAFPGSPPVGDDTPMMGPLARRVTLSSASLADQDFLLGWPRSGMRSRVQSRLAEIEAGWRTRRESSAYAAELNAVSMHHLRLILRQELARANIPNSAEWESTLVNLGLRLSVYQFGNPRSGEPIDPRLWVKIKKIPGGAPRDSECVDGVMITKNVAHKNMLRVMKGPRIMLVTFPLEYQRVEGQFMPLEPLVAQEKEYLANLVSRVAALRPHLVLVERSVSRIALELLLEKNIAVGRTVKASAIATIARATQADVISSIDRLALEPRLGYCTRFRVQTFEHDLIPGRRRSYMRFEGCHRETGCTLVLRGGDMETLRKVKTITKFMIFVVRNLKMETFLWRDLLLSMPQLPQEASPLPVSSDLESDDGDLTPQAQRTGTSMSHPLDGEDLSDPFIRLSRKIHETAAPYRTNFLSASATLRFPAPYPVRHMLELDEHLTRLKREWEHHEAKQILAEERADLLSRMGSTAASPSEHGLELPKTPTASDAAALKALDEHLGYFDQLPPPPSTATTATNINHTVSSFMKAAAADHPVHIRHPSEIELKGAVERARFDLEEYRKMWSWYTHKNADTFHIENYQKITVLTTVLPVTTKELARSCVPPKLEVIEFYGKNDLTLGQFVENQCNSMKNRCSGKACDKPFREHSRVFVHNESRVVVNVEHWEDRGSWKGPAALDNPDRMITWSVCESCNLSTPFIPLTEESWRYSFAKFLELFFYPADVVPLSGIACYHNVYQHHVRYFWWRHTAVRFQVAPVKLHEATLPPLHTLIRPESLVELKNRDYESILSKQAAFWDSVVRRVHHISTTEVTGQIQEKQDKMTKIAAVTPDLLFRAEADRHELLALTRKVYDDSPMTDTLAFSAVRTSLQAKVLLWDQKFAEYERLFFPSDRDILRRATASQLRRLFANQEISTAFDRTHAQPTVVEVDEKAAARVLELVSSVPSDTSEADSMSLSSMDPFPSSSEDNGLVSNDSPETPMPTNGLPVIAITTPGEEAPAQQSKDAEGSCQAVPPCISDHDSDSTIEAPRKSAGVSPVEPVASESTVQSPTSEKDDYHFASRLPRRRLNPAVADLVKRFQDQDGSSEPDGRVPSPEKPLDDAHGELRPPRLKRDLSESTARPRKKTRTKTTSSKARMGETGFTSDFEQGYAANVGPKYLENAQNAASRIPQPLSGPSRPFAFKSQTTAMLKPPSGAVVPGRHVAGKGKSVLRGVTRERSLSKTPSISSMNALKAGSRRVTGPVTNKVSTLTKQYERIARDTDRAARRTSHLRYRRARPLATTQTRIQLFDNVKDAIRDESDSSSSSSEADDEDDGDEETLPSSTTDKQEPTVEVSADGTQQPSPVNDQPLGPAGEASSLSPEPLTIAMPPIDFISPGPSQASSPTYPGMVPITSTSVSTQASETEAGSGGTEKHPSLLKSITGGLWASRSGDWPPLDYPSSSLEHLFADSPIVIREDEPTSIIAFALSTTEYKEQIKPAQDAKVPPRYDSLVPDEQLLGDRDSSWGVINPEDLIPDVEDVLKQTKAIHSNQIFESGGTSIFCRIFFAEQFDALRRTCGCDDSFVESLARCLKWDATGGKSGSAFLKTRDDRFIAKELSRPELAAMTKFAPAYFEYMSNAFSMKKPTVLAKVFGFYKVGYKNPHTGKSMKMNLLVMENLFYERRFSKIYDLKGSMRNRHIQSTGRVNEVLLDENLVQNSHLTPWYIREHSKCILRVALWNDASFLCDLNVMDYSLLVGVDSERNELVLGIVDFIRTYTWDKKLESWVKESAFLGGGNRGEPTIVTPKQYKSRFLAAMERYLLMVPDRWMKRQDQPDLCGDELLGELWREQ